MLIRKLTDDVKFEIKSTEMRDARGGGCRTPYSLLFVSVYLNTTAVSYCFMSTPVDSLYVTFF